MEGYSEAEMIELARTRKRFNKQRGKIREELSPRVHKVNSPMQSMSVTHKPTLESYEKHASELASSHPSVGGVSIRVSRDPRLTCFESGFFATEPEATKVPWKATYMRANPTNEPHDAKLGWEAFAKMDPPTVGPPADPDDPNVFRLSTSRTSAESMLRSTGQWPSQAAIAGTKGRPHSAGWPQGARRAY